MSERFAHHTRAEVSISVDAVSTPPQRPTAPLLAPRDDRGYSLSMDQFVRTPGIEKAAAAMTLLGAGMMGMRRPAGRGGRD
jgi:hypothetical protein